MTILSDLFTIDCIVINSPARNRAEAFAAAGNLFKSKLGISSRLVVDCINFREDLSSTALGSGVAIPHGIVAGIQIPIGCLIKLAEPIDFAAPDGDKVTILIFLLFPQIATHEHLQILSYLAQRLLDVRVRGKIISEQRPEKICQLLNLSIDFEETLQTKESHSGFKQYMTSSNQDIQDYLEEWAILAQRPSQNLH
jgi:PTS system nitrogen regulatory IIA component